MISVSLCITHAAFVPQRQKSMQRLREQLKLGDIVLDQDDGHAGFVTVPNFGRIPYREETDRSPHHEWSARQWGWCRDQKVDWAIVLQDDLLAAPTFWNRFEQAIQQIPYYSDPPWLNLLTNHPGSRQAFLEGRLFYETVDGLNGTGYAASSVEFGKLLSWRAYDILPGQVEKVSEDVLVALYCLANHRKILTPLPGLIDHDLSVGTLHPQEHQQNRRAFVRWDDGERGLHGRQEQSVAPFGRFYETAHAMLPGVLIDSIQGVKLAREYELLKCPPSYGRMFEMVVAQKDWP